LVKLEMMWLCSAVMLICPSGLYSVAGNNGPLCDAQETLHELANSVSSTATNWPWQHRAWASMAFDQS
jgi:hypothetical protein